MAIKKPLVLDGGNIRQLAEDEYLYTPSIFKRKMPECVFSANFNACNGWDLPNRVGSGFTYFNKAVTVNVDGSITLDGTMYAFCKYVRFPVEKATYHFKFKTSYNSGNQKFFAMGKGDDTDTPQSNNFDIGLDSTGKLYFFTERGAGDNYSTYVDTGVILNDGNKHDVVITIDGSVLNVWVDGVKTNTDESWTSPEAAIWETLCLFSNALTGGSTYFTGDFFDFDVFNGILEEEQIIELYKNGYSNIGFGVINIDTFRGALVKQSSKFNLPAATWTKITSWDTAEYDTDGFLQGGELVVPEGVKRVRVSCLLNIENNNEKKAFEIRLNDNKVVGYARQEVGYPSGWYYTSTINSAVIEVQPGDKFSVYALCDAACTIGLGSWFSIEVIQDIPAKSVHLADMPKDLTGKDNQILCVLNEEYTLKSSRELRSLLAYNTVYVDAVNGDDSNDGSEVSPVKTVKQACYILGDSFHGRIFLKSDCSITEDIYVFLRRLVIDLNGFTLSFTVNSTSQIFGFYAEACFIHFYSKVSGGKIRLPSPAADTSDLNNHPCAVKGGVQGGDFVGLTVNYGAEVEVNSDKYYLIEATNRGICYNVYGTVIDNTGTGIGWEDLVYNIIRDSNGVPRNVISNVIL